VFNLTHVHYIHNCTTWARRLFFCKTLSDVLGPTFSVSRFGVTTFQVSISKHH